MGRSDKEVEKNGKLIVKTNYYIYRFSFFVIIFIFVISMIGDLLCWKDGQIKFPIFFSIAIIPTIILIIIYAFFLEQLSSKFEKDKNILIVESNKLTLICEKQVKEFGIHDYNFTFNPINYSIFDFILMHPCICIYDKATDAFIDSIDIGLRNVKKVRKVVNRDIYWFIINRE